ncbi:MAG: enolase C-terminal domain-like protein [Acidobacteriota bacterium]
MNARGIEHVAARAVRLPTLRVPETDGTGTWAATTMVIVQVSAAGETGIGYSYVDAAAAGVVEHLLAGCLHDVDCFAIPMLHARMVRAVRNHGRAGVCACAISAVDIALWDLKAKLVEAPLAELLGCARREVPVYASGGFTSTPLDELAREVASYADAGHVRVKIKIGRNARADLERVRVAREAAPGVALMVDANGAYTRKQARALADRFALDGVVYFEEPVSSDDLDGLRALRDASTLDIAAGEYGYDPYYFRAMLAAGAVDIVQADATRCLGITGFLAAAALADAAQVPLSAHCAPAIHAHAAAAVPRLAHVEHFFDHVRMEQLIFDGAPLATAGVLGYDARRPGLGLELRVRELERHAA